MDIKDFEKATKILTEIKQLQLEGGELDKMALLILQEESEVSFKLKLNKKIDPAMVRMDDSPGTVRLGLFETMRRDLMNIEPFLGEKQEKETPLNKKIPDELALQLIGVFLAYNESHKQKLINQLANYGIRI